MVSPALVMLDVRRKKGGSDRLNEKNRKAVLSHLAKYKREKLNIRANGIWWGNKKEYPHILPKNSYESNIIDEGYRERILKMIDQRSRHLGFHHMNSSQALTANLFGPYIAEGKLDELSNLFGLELMNGKGLLEYIKDKAEGTNFDFAVTGLQECLYVEVKYTEDRFASGKRDQRHFMKFETIYQEHLKRIADIEASEFLRDYQLWRNIRYSNLGLVAFVIPKFRKDLSEKVQAVRKRINNPEKVRTVWIDDICQKGECDSTPMMRAHYGEFRKKYLSITSA